MSLTPEMRRMFQRTLDQIAHNEAEAKKIHSRFLDMLVGKGLRLSPMGVQVSIAAGSAIAQLNHHHTDGECNMLSPDAALEVFDEFCLTWAVQRLAEDSNAFHSIACAVRPQTKLLYCDEPGEVKLT